MRVLLVNDWPANEGGVERYLDWLRGELTAAGDEVRLLASSAGSAADGSADVVARASTKASAQAVLQLVNPFAVAAARTAVRSLRPDVVHVFMFEANLSPAVFAAFRGLPTVVTVANYKPVCPTAVKLLPDGTICGRRRGRACVRAGCVGRAHALRDVPRYALIERALRSAERILAPSEWVAAELRAHGLPAEACVLGVPPVATGFRRAPAPGPTFLCVARLSCEKGVDVLLRALASVDGCELRLAGDGPERGRLEQLAARLGIAGRTHFLGTVGDGGLDRELARTWALGLVAPQAIARGVPVIATATGGFAETVTPGLDGILVPNGSVDGLAAALEAVAAGRAFAERTLDEAHVARVRERFAFSAHAAAIRSRYAELAASR